VNLKGIIIYCLLTFGVSTFGYSCICKNPDFPLKYLTSDNPHFANRQKFIIKCKLIDTVDGIYMKYYGKGLAYNVKVLEYWPKDSDLNEIVTLIESDPYCPVFFRKDSIHLVAAFSMDRYLGVSECAGFSRFSKYKTQINALGPGNKPEKQKEEINKKELKTSPKVKSSKNNYLLIIGLILGLSVLLNIYLLIKLLKKHN
jgi:hypothetical protein